MRPGSVLTDAGSVKADIVREGERSAGEGVCFVGGHPIAGTENSGFPAADAALFRGRSFIATPTRATKEEALRRVERLWRLAGSKVVTRMDPKTHDRVFACVSHLPHVVAYALGHSVATLPSRVPLGYSAGGFRGLHPHRVEPTRNVEGHRPARKRKEVLAARGGAYTSEPRPPLAADRRVPTPTEIPERSSKVAKKTRDGYWGGHEPEAR
jgi:prephenate dehydrogenase